MHVCLAPSLSRKHINCAPRNMLRQSSSEIKMGATSSSNIGFLDCLSSSLMTCESTDSPKNPATHPLGLKRWPLCHPNSDQAHRRHLYTESKRLSKLVERKEAQPRKLAVQGKSPPFIACCELPLDKATAATAHTRSLRRTVTPFFLARQLGSVFNPSSQMEDWVQQKKQSGKKHI